MANFNLDEYETVETRLTKFWEDNKDNGATISTTMEYYDNDRVVFKATIDTMDSIVTGWAEETRGDGYVNRTSHLENCETSAIGRALANLGYATKGKRPSREEMSKVQRAQAKRVPVWPFQNSKEYNLPLTEVSKDLLVWYKTNKAPQGNEPDTFYNHVVAELEKRGDN